MHIKSRVEYFFAKIFEYMTFVVVLDIDPRWWNKSERFSLVVTSVKSFISGLGLSLPFPSVMDVAIIAAFPDKAVTISQGSWRDVADFSQPLLAAIADRRTLFESSTELFESPIAQGVSRGLAYITKRASVAGTGNIMVLECSTDPTDYASQTVALSNCACDSSSIRVNVVSLGSAKPSSAILGLVARTSGVHIPYQYTQSCGQLVEALQFHLAPFAVIGSLKVRPPEATQEMNAVCACHNRVIDKGYVCSICLSIYCSDSASICTVCGSRIRREAKDELPLHAQVFSKLFANRDSGAFPVTQNIFS